MYDKTADRIAKKKKVAAKIEEQVFKMHLLHHAIKIQAVRDIEFYKTILNKLNEVGNLFQQYIPDFWSRPPSPANNKNVVLPEEAQKELDAMFLSLIDIIEKF